MQKLVELAKKAAITAGEELLKIKHPMIINKVDGTLLTSADLKSNEIIIDILSQSGINVCSEEKTLSYEQRQKSPFWLIDPLDGTSNYVKTKSDFCICISLIEDNRPILGLIYDVCNKNVYYSAKGMKVFKNHDELFRIKNKSNKALMSLRKNIDSSNYDYILEHNLRGLQIGSALKFCALLEGDADIYLRFESLNSWDLAAGDFLINQSGGLMIGLDKQKLNYNRSNFACMPFIALSSYYK